MTKAVAYMRCSSAGAVFGDTWERQITEIKTCARRREDEIIHEYREPAIPGKNELDERPAFQEMIAALVDNDCKTIYVESLDRLARAYRVQEHLIIYLATKGLTLISSNTGENITEAMMGDPMRRALVQIQGILAELDKNMIVAKLRKARERKRHAGVKVEGRKSYGVRTGEATVLRLILDMSGSGQMPEQIACNLNNLQIYTRYGKLWRCATISKIVSRHVTCVPPAQANTVSTG